MKKGIFFFLVMLLVFVANPLDALRTREAAPVQESAFVAPASLRVIEESAFEGTAVQKVVFREGLRFIGERAFENAAQLTEVSLPTSVAYIGGAAFPVNEDLRLYGARGSYAWKWAGDHSIAFMPDNARGPQTADGDPLEGPGVAAALLQLISRPQTQLRLAGQAMAEGNSMRPQDRAELNPIDYRFP